MWLRRRAGSGERVAASGERGRNRARRLLAARCYQRFPAWLQRPEDGLAGEQRCVAQLLFDAQELVVLGDAVAARGGAGLDLADIGGDGEIGDGRVFGLATAVRDDGAVAGALGHLDRLERFGERADLVDLDQDG